LQPQAQQTQLVSFLPSNTNAKLPRQKGDTESDTPLTPLIGAFLQGTSEQIAIGAI